MKRFYTAAAVTGDGPFGVALDGKPLRTPARAALAVPGRALAAAIAVEWNAQVTEIQPRTMPLTGLANAAIDRVAPDVEGFADGLARFAENELLTYRAAHPAPLVAAQAAAWDPWLDWARRRYDVDFALIEGVIHRPQPPATLLRVQAAFRALDAFRLAALNPVVTISGSAIIGLAVAEGAMDAATAWAVGHLDELWQAEQWGKDPLAEAGHAERQADLGAAVAMLQLL
ncbi:ATP12 family chaperone protein [Polymorphobacter fuscus]|uniref:ATPase n=1 Tax=Sandarakinorhabdus fusca TaxID=1439888 RepID=A0A7C9GWY3_9SPHN|nr:ATP12 family protein [Polymorphobacter fuscus]KAB7643861.1 ATPase [Polymorphobacter fuscus]MQT18558.1 ATPase [Polymorphobacter fuscus]NJC07075.1 chaperone required for assembly of F1-ATPase [Polymorphobacter fuscus]